MASPDGVRMTNPKRYDWHSDGMWNIEGGRWVAWADYERLQEVLTIPLVTPDTTSSALFIRVLSEHEKGQPVNTQDLINALMWRVRNQKRELARLHEKRGSSEPSEQHSTEDDFQHFLSYSGLRGQNEAALGQAFYAGANVPPRLKSRAYPLCNCQEGECHGPDVAQANGALCRAETK